MEITNAQYIRDTVLSNEKVAINCIIDGEHHRIPLKPGNRHYDEIMRQVEAGELTIQDAE